MYSIFFKKSAQKELSEISTPFKANIIKAIDNLAIDPRPEGIKKLRGSDFAYRIRVEIIESSTS